MTRGAVSLDLISTFRLPVSYQFIPNELYRMPTQYMIVNALESLEIVGYRSATVAHTVGGKDFSDQQILLEADGSV